MKTLFEIEKKMRIFLFSTCEFLLLYFLLEIQIQNIGSNYPK